MIEWLVQYSGYIVLVAFFASFAGIAVWAYWPSSRARLEALRNIPLEQGDE